MWGNRFIQHTWRKIVTCLIGPVSSISFRRKSKHSSTLIPTCSGLPATHSDHFLAPRDFAFFWIQTDKSFWVSQKKKLSQPIRGQFSYTLINSVILKITCSSEERDIFTKARGEKLSTNECQGSDADGDFLFFSKARWKRAEITAWWFPFLSSRESGQGSQGRPTRWGEVFVALKRCLLFKLFSCGRFYNRHLDSWFHMLRATNNRLFHKRWQSSSNRLQAKDVK